MERTFKIYESLRRDHRGLLAKASQPPCDPRARRLPQCGQANLSQGRTTIQRPWFHPVEQCNQHLARRIGNVASRKPRAAVSAMARANLREKLGGMAP